MVECEGFPHRAAVGAGDVSRARRSGIESAAPQDVGGRSRHPTATLPLLGLLLAASGCTAIVDHYSGRTEACAILAIGQRATATIMRLIDTGTTINQDPVVEFVLEVHSQEGEVYEARTRALVSRLAVPQVQPGRTVPVEVGPADRRRVALDLWDCRNS